MKAIVVSDVMCACPNPNLPFKLHTDSSNCQMEAATVQDGKVAAHWSCKLNVAQRNHRVMEKEMLAVVMCSKEF